MFTVDFDFNRELLVDDVFPMNETTQLRIFGKGSDAIYVNELLQKQLDSL